MDIISYSLASKHARNENKTRYEVLGEGVQGIYKDMKERIDAIDHEVGKATEKANQMIINDAVNIMKAHAKLNAIAGSMKYHMHQMFFDDLLDLSGIDTAVSQSYNHDSVEGSLTSTGTNTVIETSIEVMEADPEKVVLTAEAETLQPIISQVTIRYGGFDHTVNTTGYEDFSVNYSYLPYMYFFILRNQSGREYAYMTAGESPISFSNFSGNLFIESESPYYLLTGGGTSVTERSGEREKFFSNHSRITLHQVLSLIEKDGTFVMDAYGSEFEYRSHTLEVCEISKDSGHTWEPIKLNELFYFKHNDNMETGIKIRFYLPDQAKLLNYGLTWS